MIITIASGKGGTGKTTVAVNMVAALVRTRGGRGRVGLLDCDVEEPNDHLFVRPSFSWTETVQVPRPQWNAELCTGCGKCQEACPYNAIAVVRKRGSSPAGNGPEVLVFPELCHACGACSYVCPEGALTEQPASVGKVQVDPDSREFYFAHGVLNVGETLAPAVVRRVARHAEALDLTLIDAPPGTACPVVEAVRAADAVILVTEPTPFGLNDLRLALNMTLQLRVPAGVVVNRSDGEDEIIGRYADKVGVPVLGRLPFDRRYAEVYSRGGLLVDEFPEVADVLLDVCSGAVALAGTKPPPAPGERFPAETAAGDIGRPHGVTAAGFRECTIISGKGGTGKTTVTAALAALAEDKVLADCDVDAADLHLLLRPEVLEVREFWGGRKASINPEVCTGCGRCAELCHFDAIEAIEGEGPSEPPVYGVDELACEGCGLCGYVCPVHAVEIGEVRTGQSYVSRTPYGPMSHARLGIAEENTGKLVTCVRERAAELAQHGARSLVLNDGSPGTGCPVIASIAGVDYALIVTEPTVSGVHDLERVIALCRHFGVRALVCINKSDLNAEQAERIREMAGECEARVIGEIPFDPAVNEALCERLNVVEFGRGEAAAAVRRVWDALRAELSRP